MWRALSYEREGQSGSSLSGRRQSSSCVGYQGHPDYLADEINGDRLEVYDGLHSARFGNAKRSLALRMNNNSDKTKVGSVCSAQINV